MRLKVTTWFQHSIESQTLSLQVNRPSHSRNTTFSKFDLENSRSISCYKVGVTYFRVTSLSLHVNRPFHFRDIFFLNLTLKIQGEGEMAMVLHHYRSRRFHITSNGVNPSSGFRDMGSVKSGPSSA